MDGGRWLDKVNRGLRKGSLQTKQNDMLNDPIHAFNSVFQSPTSPIAVNLEDYQNLAFNPAQT